MNNNKIAQLTQLLKKHKNYIPYTSTTYANMRTTVLHFGNTANKEVTGILITLPDKEGDFKIHICGNAVCTPALNRNPSWSIRKWNTQIDYTTNVLDFHIEDLATFLLEIVDECLNKTLV